MTTTCIPQPTTLTCPTVTSSRSAGLVSVRSAVATVLSRSGGRGGTLERRAVRSTPSDVALEVIETFPGLRR